MSIEIGSSIKELKIAHTLDSSKNMSFLKIFRTTKISRNLRQNISLQKHTGEEWVLKTRVADALIFSFHKR